MANEYLHGAFGKLLDSKVQSAVQSGTAPVYIGMARINLVRGYAEKKLVNYPVELVNLSHAQRTVGWSANGWDSGWGISEAITAHFDNVKGNTGPIYVINVFDPDTHRKADKTVKTLTFINKTAQIASDDIILDSLVLKENIETVKAVEDHVVTYEAENLNPDSLLVYVSESSANTAAIETDYTATYENNVLTITLVSDGALYSSSNIKFKIAQTRIEDIDYALSYNYAASLLTIRQLGEGMSDSMNAEYYEADVSAITPETIIGSAVDYTGIYAVKKCFPDLNVVPNLLCAPYWGEYPTVYNALVAASQKINGHWFAFTLADIPLDYISTVNTTLTVSSHTATYTADDLDVDTLVVYGSGSEIPATAGSDYNVVYSAGVLSISLVEVGTIYSSANIRISVEQKRRNDTIAKTGEWKTAHGYESEFSKVFWPRVQDGSGRKFHLSTLACAEFLRVDNAHEDIPFETIDNKGIPAVEPYFGENVEYYFDNEEADALCAAGITTAISWGGDFVLWGAHTGAYTFGDSQMDARGIFDCTIRTLFYLVNGFQRRHIKDIGAPLTLRKVQEIMHEENSEYRRCKGLGALLGTVEIAFTAADNSRTDMLNGDFTWSFDPTVTPPLKSATLGVAYSDAGFESYFDVFTEEGVEA